jgi:GNAT superfamily N-acetyltransferase
MRLCDRSVVYGGLLPVIAASYPHADRWLKRRLDDVLDAKADCFLARDARGLTGVVIQAPKGPARLKLSTIWVAPRARGRGLGGALLERCHALWHRRDIDEVWITAGPNALESVGRLLAPHGFVPCAYEPGRYRHGQIETVLCWTPATDRCRRAVKDSSGPAPQPSRALPTTYRVPGWDLTRPAWLSISDSGPVAAGS